MNLWNFENWHSDIRKKKLNVVITSGVLKYVRSCHGVDCSTNTS